MKRRGLTNMNMKSQNKTHVLFVICLIFIFAIIGGLIYQQESILRSGDTVILKTRPVDPRDLLRGEYVILRYEIETDEQVVQYLEDRQQERDPDIQYARSREVVYLKLEEVGGIHQVAQISSQMGESGVWIEGNIQSGRVRFPDLEQYFVPEGAGLPIERLGSGIHVEVVVKDGESRIIRLLDKNLVEIDPRDYLEE